MLELAALAALQKSVLFNLGVDLVSLASAGPLTLSYGRKLRDQLGELTSEHNLGENHDIVRALRKARLLACSTVVHQTHRSTNTRVEDSPFLSSIDRWISSELARSINKESDPRFLDQPASDVKFADDEKLKKSWQTLKQIWKDLVVENNAGNKTPWIGPCEVLALCQLWQFFLSDEAQKQAATDEAVSPVDELANKFNVWTHTDLIIQAFPMTDAVSVLNTEAMKSDIATAFKDNFNDEKTGFFATYRVLIRQALVNDKPFQVKLQAMLGAQSIDEIKQLGKEFDKGLEDIRGRLGHLIEMMEQGHESLLSAHHAHSKDLALLLSYAEDQQATIEELLSAIGSGPRLDHLVRSVNQHHVGHGLQLKYNLRATHFIGRESHKNALDKFFDDKRNFSWWHLAGNAGQGKSRLALEMLDQKLAEGWVGGFLKDFSADHVNQLRNWRIRHPTLLIVDYIAAPQRAELMRTMISIIEARNEQNNLPQKIRLLVLERQPYDLAQDDNTSSVASSEWQNILFFNNTPADLIIRCRNSVYAQDIDKPSRSMVLNDMDDTQLMEISHVWCLHREGRRLTAEEATHVAACLSLGKQATDPPPAGFDRENRARRPLFAMIAAEAAIRNEQANTIEALLTFVLDTEYHEFFREDRPKQREGYDLDAVKLALMANIVRDFDPCVRHDSVKLNLLTDNLHTIQQAHRYLGRDFSIENIDGSTNIIAREPDLIAEFQVLQFYRSVCEKKAKGRTLRESETGELEEWRQLIDTAWLINASELWEFLNRAREDFITHPALAIAAYVIPESQKISWSRLAFNLITDYGNAEKWQEATTLYDNLTALAEQFDEAPLRELQAKAAFNLIIAYGNAEKWQEATSLYDKLTALAEQFDEAPLREWQASAAFNLINAYGQAKRWQEATSLYDKLTALAQQFDKAPLREEQTKAAVNLIHAYGNAEKWQEATSLYDKLTALAQQFDEAPLRESQASAAVNLINAYGQAEKWQEATSLYAKLTALAQQFDEAPLRELQAKAAFNLINAYGQAEKWQEATSLYDKLTALAQQFDEAPLRELQAIAAFNLITAYGNAEKWQEATSLYDNLTALAQQFDEAPLREEQAKAPVNLINAYGQAEKWQEATSLYDNLTALAQQFDEAPLRELQATAAVNLINAYGQAEKWQEATSLYDKLTALAQQFDEAPLRESQAKAAVSLILAYGQAEKWQEATSLYDKLTALAQQFDEAPLREWQASAAINLINAYGQAEKWQETTSLYDKLTALAQQFDEAPLRESQAKAAVSLILAYGQAEKWQEATSLYDNLTALAQQFDEAPLRELQAIAALNLINAYVQAEKWQEATSLYDNLTALAQQFNEAPLREWQAKAAVNLINVYGNAEKWQEATSLYDKLTALAQQFDEAPLRELQAKAAVNLIHDYGQAKRWQEATSLYDKLTALAQQFDEAPLPESQAAAMGSLSMAYHENGDFDQATKCFYVLQEIVNGNAGRPGFGLSISAVEELKKHLGL